MPDIGAVLAALTPYERRQLDVLLATAPPTTLRQPSLAEFIRSSYPTYQFWPYLSQLSMVLERVVAGEIPRLLIALPVRLGKSLTVSRLLPAYFLRRYPDRWVALASYSAELAHNNSRHARSYYTGHGLGTLSVEAVKHWETGKGGGLWAVGVGGPATGKGLHLGIIDDPIKNAKEAESGIVRQRIRDWYDATFTSRLEPGAAIIVMMARWHEEDLLGDLLHRELDEPEHWHVVHWPAIAEPWPAFPPSCTVEPDAQRIDGVLCPDRYPREKLDRLKARVGAYWFSALWQQRPQPREGNFFKRAWFPVVDAMPPSEQTTAVRGWDQAASAGDGDYSAGVLLRRTGDGTVYVCDVVRGQWDSGARDRQIVATADADGRSVRIQGEQEPGAAGKDAVRAFARLLEGFTFGVKPATGDKSTKAGPFASHAEAGRVRLVRGAWNAAYLDELMSFPTGRHDDQVDASSIGFNTLMTMQGVDVAPLSLTQVSKWR